MIIFIHYLTSVITGAAVLTFMSILLPNSLNAFKIVAYSVVIGLFPIARFLAEYFGFDTFMVAVSVLMIICIPALLILPFKGRLLNRVLVIVGLGVIQGFSELISMFATYRLYYNPDYALFTTASWIIHSMISLTLFIFLGFLFVSIWKMIDMQKFQPFLLLLLIMPVSQLMLIFTHFTPSPYIVYILGVSIGLAGNLLLLVYVVNIGKKAEIENELRETRHAMALEQSHYRHVEERREELAKIRHDFNNQLAAIGRLLEAGEDTQRMVSSLAAEIMDTRENVFCSIPVVNAILLEKSQACAAAGIKLKTELSIPPTITMEQIHLCSIFGNLLDNAIKACKNNNTRQSHPIHLAAKQEGDYLIIKTQNPSEKPPKKPAPGHGLGLRIVSDLAKQYGGDFHAEYRDGVFTTVVSVVV